MHEALFTTEIAGTPDSCQNCESGTFYFYILFQILKCATSSDVIIALCDTRMSFSCYNRECSTRRVALCSHATAPGSFCYRIAAEGYNDVAKSCTPHVMKPESALKPSTQLVFFQ